MENEMTMIPTQHPDGSISSAGSTPFPSMQDTLNKYDSVFPRCFSGAKVVYTYPLSSNLQTTHALKITTSPNDCSDDGYRLGVLYVGNKQINRTENYPLFLGESDVQGNASGMLLHHLSDRIRMRYRQSFGEIGPQAQHKTEVGIEYRGDLTHLGLTIVDPKPYSWGGGYMLNVMRNIYGALDGGAKIQGILNDPNMPESHLYNTSYVARFSTPEWTIGGEASDSTLNVIYHQKVAKNAEVSVGLNGSWQEGAVARVGYQLEIPSEMIFRASYDSDWTASGVLEKRLSDVRIGPPLTMMISAALNHATRQASVGLGLNVG